MTGPTPPEIGIVFAALSDPTRRALLGALRHGPLSVSRLASPFNMTLTAVAQHLQILEGAGLVHTEKLGRIRTCRLDRPGFAALETWLVDHRTPWEEKLDQLRGC